ncbi:MAG: hypothetical protein N2645_21015 [Clostridia bacterium]|nr:hypothetical protein [Clostridia bacterium]
MRNITFLSNTNPFTIKTKSIIELDKSGLTVPNTIICHNISTENIEKMEQITQKWGCEWLYMRINFSDTTYPHYFNSLAPVNLFKDEINMLHLKGVQNNILNYDFIIQPLLELSWSGGLIYKNKRLLIELVVGAPTSLFRGGHFAYRCIVEKNTVVSEKNGIQPEIIVWEKGKWLRKKNNALPDFNSIINEISALKYEENSMYEFGYKDKLYFFERKTVFDNTYINFDNGNIDLPFVIYKGNYTYANDIVFDYPKFEYISEIKEDNNLIIKGGAYLSHFAYYMSQHKRQCTFQE